MGGGGGYHGLYSSRIPCIVSHQVDIDTAIKLYGVHNTDFVQYIVAVLVTVHCGAVWGILVSIGLSVCVMGGTRLFGHAEGAQTCAGAERVARFALRQSP